MKRQKKFKMIVREMLDLIINFIKPYKNKEEILSMPKDIRKMGYKFGIMGSIMTVVSSAFAYLLLLSNIMIEHRLILLGIMFFMLNHGQRILSAAYQIFKNSEQEKYGTIIEDEIVFRGAKIIGEVSNKVLKYDEENKVYRVLTNEQIANALKRYLVNFWDYTISHVFDIVSMFNVLVMVTGAIMANNKIPQKVFIPTIIVFSIISFLESAFTGELQRKYHKNNRGYDDRQSIISNDLLRVPAIVPKDLEMRLKKFKETLKESKKNVTEYTQKKNFLRLATTVVEVFLQYGIIILYLIGIDWNSINLATITQLVAVVEIFSKAMGLVRSITSSLSNNEKVISTLKKEEEDLNLILATYYREIEKKKKAKIIKNIAIDEFSISYMEKSENDRAFTLVSNKKIQINGGEIAILYGPSGSGKSTFMNLLTERIKLNYTTEIPSTSRYLFYDEKLEFGSLSLFEELFCGEENPDLEKMQTILENLHLWYEIKANCFDIWLWLKEKKFNDSLSNGQKQRMILAKMLYWLDDDIDVLVLDECTSGLDEKTDDEGADAEGILEYVIRYANKDKKRITVIATHQNIDGFIKNMADFQFRFFKFMKKGEQNIITEI